MEVGGDAWELTATTDGIVANKMEHQSPKERIEQQQSSYTQPAAEQQVKANNRAKENNEQVMVDRQSWRVHYV